MGNAENCKLLEAGILKIFLGTVIIANSAALCSILILFFQNVAKMNFRNESSIRKIVLRKNMFLYKKRNNINICSESQSV